MRLQSGNWDGVMRALRRGDRSIAPRVAGAVLPKRFFPDPRVRQAAQVGNNVGTIAAEYPHKP
jgi:hypothetical protein